jgi:hypothetical protein
MSEEETTADVVGVRISVTVFVMHPVVTNPFVCRSLQKKIGPLLLHQLRKPLLRFLTLPGKSGVAEIPKEEKRTPALFNTVLNLPLTSSKPVN